MPKQERLTAKDAVKLLVKAGFIFSRQSGSHAQYFRNGERITVPIHGDRILHPKITKQILNVVKQVEI